MLRGIFAALLLLTLAACNRGGATAPFAESRPPPQLGPRFLAPEAWAWGYVQVGEKPPQRYGVASTWRVPRAVVVVLPGYGESIETWFETIADLTRRGYTVWALDRIGQGGSGRYTLPRDLGFAPSLDPDVAGLKALVRVVIRPRPDAPLILVAHADGAVVALRALETGLDADGLILSSPSLPHTPKSTDGVSALISNLPGLDRAPSPGYRPWSRDIPDELARGLTHDPWRGGVTHAWQLANPDLRMVDPTPGWRRAVGETGDAARADAAKVRPQVLMLTAGPGSAEDQALCRALPACRPAPIAGARPALHLEADRWRSPWFAAISGFIAGKVDRARAVLPVAGDAGLAGSSENTEDSAPAASDHAL